MDRIWGTLNNCYLEVLTNLCKRFKNTVPATVEALKALQEAKGPETAFEAWFDPDINGNRLATCIHNKNADKFFLRSKILGAQLGGRETFDRLSAEEQEHLWKSLVFLVRWSAIIRNYRPLIETFTKNPPTGSEKATTPQEMLRHIYSNPECIEKLRETSLSSGGLDDTFANLSTFMDGIGIGGSDSEEESGEAEAEAEAEAEEGEVTASKLMSQKRETEKKKKRKKKKKKNLKKHLKKQFEQYGEEEKKEVHETMSQLFSTGGQDIGEMTSAMMKGDMAGMTNHLLALTKKTEAESFNEEETRKDIESALQCFPMLQGGLDLEALKTKNPMDMMQTMLQKIQPLDKDRQCTLEDLEKQMTKLATEEKNVDPSL